MFASSRRQPDFLSQGGTSTRESSPLQPQEKEVKDVSCLNPNLMYDRGAMYPPSERYKFLGSLKGYCEKNGRSADALLRSPNYMLIPCKHCLACQRAKAMDWATRAAQEILYHPKGTSYFVTLTYDEANLPRWYKDDSEEGGHMERGPGDGVPCLWHKDIQDYHKRLRAAQEYAAKKSGEEPERIRYLQCGEYGTKKGRPHYHEVISGLILPDVRFVRAKSSTQLLFESEYLAKMWPWGRIEIQDATQEAAAYVAQYTVKKAYSLEAKREYEEKGIRGPYICVSRGYGSEWTLDNWDNYVGRGVKMVVHTAHGYRQAGLTAWAKRKQKEAMTPEEREAMHARGQLNQQSNCEKLRRQHPGLGIVEANEQEEKKLWDEVRRRTHNLDRKGPE